MGIVIVEMTFKLLVGNHNVNCGSKLIIVQSPLVYRSGVAGRVTTLQVSDLGLIPDRSGILIPTLGLEQGSLSLVRIIE